MSFCGLVKTWKPGTSALGLVGESGPFPSYKQRSIMLCVPGGFPFPHPRSP